MQRHQNEAFLATFDPDTGIAGLEMAMPGGVNRIDPRFEEGLAKALAWIRERESCRGVILTSGHRDFCVGADLEGLVKERSAERLLERVLRLHRLLRELETGGLPVVAVIEGSALGGGLELALACHRRLALGEARLRLGLPEVTLGLFPGLGGTQRLPRLLGLQTALELVVQGRVLRPAQALEKGVLDEVHDDPESLRRAAVDWIRAHPEARQPWDQPRFRFPSPAPDSDRGRQVMMAGMALLYKRTAGAAPAPERAFRVVQEGARLAFDRALELEARHFAPLAVSDGARDMIRTFWFHRRAAERHDGLPRAEDPRIERVGILGAGLMGAGLALLCARRGLDVILQDIDPSALERAEADFHTWLERHRKRAGEATVEEIRHRLRTTASPEDLHDRDLVIEAVFEDLQLKRRIIGDLVPRLPEHALFASNTSALPIGELARASPRPGQMVGLHFFSPVERMPLVEIIPAAATAEETTGRSLAFADRLGKVPIVVRDAYGFYTTRVFATYVLEGAQLLTEGHDPAVVEWAARQAGMAAAPLQVLDEVGLHLGLHVMEQSRRYAEDPVGDRLDIPGTALIARMVRTHGRTGRAGGAGFYDYEDGRRQDLWSELRRETGTGSAAATARALGRRLLLVQAAEVARALGEGIVQRPRDAELGAVMGIGFAPVTGGPLAWMDRQGLPALVEELRETAERHGSRYAPHPLLVGMAERGERFHRDLSG